MIEIAVNDAVVTLVGTVESLSHKRLADVLAWWTIGAVDVRNRLHVEPPEQGNDDEITDALRIVLEMDPWLDAGQIQVHTRDQKIHLDGLVRSPEQKHMAECNAWYILGVHEVINRIAVQA
jgi:osmotically-inducible protein OsmY